MIWMLTRSEVGERRSCRPSSPRSSGCSSIAPRTRRLRARICTCQGSVQRFGREAFDDIVHHRVQEFGLVGEVPVDAMVEAPSTRPSPRMFSALSPLASISSRAAARILSRDSSARGAIVAFRSRGAELRCVGAA